MSNPPMLDYPERLPMATAPVSVVLLAQNPEADLEETLNSWVGLLDGLNQEYEILFVDGGTGQTETLAERYPHVRILNSPTGRGLGAMLRTGLAAAQKPLLFYTTCDRQYQPSDLPLLLKWIDKTDLVSGFRVGASGTPFRSWKETAYRWLVRLLFAVRLKDVNCWFLLARRCVFERIPVQSDGVFAQAEILAKANFLGCLMTDVPVHYRPSTGTSSGSVNHSLSGIWTQMCRVFSHPDFGPAIIPDKSCPNPSADIGSA